MDKKILFSLSIIIILVFLGGCGTGKAGELGKIATGNLTVISNPSGASLYVDDKYVGTTPIMGSGLIKGQHRVRITKEGYKEYRKAVYIQKDRMAKLEVVLEPKK